MPTVAVQLLKTRVTSVNCLVSLKVSSFFYKSQFAWGLLNKYDGLDYTLVHWVSRIVFHWINTLVSFKEQLFLSLVDFPNLIMMAKTPYKTQLLKSLRQVEYFVFTWLSNLGRTIKFVKVGLFSDKWFWVGQFCNHLFIGFQFIQQSFLIED